ncbi:hypothetical protein [Candidatus Mycolicibacterium alkanivorans]|uniref:Transposase n=1 Tax=Candidatus Mycolicibacterium alkanivorans TaxID=2954114 RepID=A0ABS9YQ80_9MYCO|nr:hypothetical protein [Candidatus Mycolicibacterium alkanivorans]MCI4673453.1 hypothetical protein [Candidatus Mycolicibacterium alkanivorans]
MEGAEDLEVQALKNSPAYGARNVQIVAAGTGEALPGPVTCEMCCWSAALYNGASGFCVGPVFGLTGVSGRICRMRDTELYRHLLGLETPWKVGRVELSATDGRVDVWVEHPARTRFSCPDCDAVLSVYDHSAERAWRLWTRVRY